MKTVKDRGAVPINILMISLLVFVLALSLAGISIKVLANQRSSIQTYMESLLKDSVKAAINSPLPQAIDMDPESLQANVVQIYAEKLQITRGSIVVNKFMVFTDENKGDPAPAGIQGEIPGRSVYVDLLVTWTTPSVMGVQHTGTYSVRSLVTLPAFFAPGQTWN